MTADERLALIRTKIERANEHIRHLNAECRTYLKSKPYTIGVKRDPETRKLSYYVVSIVPPPIRLMMFTGDALQNTRSALDHLAYQLCLVAGGTAKQLRSVQFPIMDSAEEYESGKRRKIEGLRPEAIKAIDATKPYQGGNDVLWRLHRLNNIDKHRTVMVGGTRPGGVDLARHSMRAHPTFPQVEFPPAYFRVVSPSDDGFPLKAGDILFRGAPDEEPDPEQKFRFEIAFNEPGIRKGQPIIETLQQTADLVDNLVTSFLPLLG
jgi:hypothetical protein